MICTEHRIMTKFTSWTIQFTSSSLSTNNIWIHVTIQKREEHNHYKHPKIKALQRPRDIDIKIFIHSISDLNCWQTMLVIKFS